MAVVAVSEYDRTALLTIDDGKVNAFGAQTLDELDTALDRCVGAEALVIAGRPGSFSAGLDTKVFAAASEDELVAFLGTWARILMRIWTFDRPVVAAATGHALAGGTMLAMACDHAVAALGDFRWGLTETRLGFAVPRYALALAHQRVPTALWGVIVLGGAMIGPDEALSAGFVHETREPDDVTPRALEIAGDLSGIATGAYAETKRRLRGEAAQEVLAGLEADLHEVVGAGLR